MPPVGEVEHPQKRHLDRLLVDVAADRAVQTAAAELRLALGLQVDVRVVPLEDLEDGENLVEGVADLRGTDKAEIVRRRVVFGIFAVRRPPEATDGQVEPRGAELALV